MEIGSGGTRRYERVQGPIGLYYKRKQNGTDSAYLLHIPTTGKLPLLTSFLHQFELNSVKFRTHGVKFRTHELNSGHRVKFKTQS